jgi:hypothetical protein
MAAYELGFLTTTVASGSNGFEFRAGADPAYIYEIGLSLAAATATTVGLGRPANTVGVGGTLTVGQGNVSDDAASTAGVVLSGWTTVPTVPAQFLRRFAAPAAVGNGWIWQWPQGLRVKQATSVVLWNLAANSALNGYVCWAD